MRVILGSQSQWRRQYFEKALPEGWDTNVELMSADIDEYAIRHPDVSTMTLLIAKAKAEELVRQLSSDATITREAPVLLVTADQVVVHKGVVREKPKDAAQAKEFLQSYKDSPAETVTAVVVTHLPSKKHLSGVDKAIQHFSAIPDEVAEQMIDGGRGPIMTCAGAFIVESPLLEPFRGETIGEIESVQGMPQALTKRLLLEACEF